MNIAVEISERLSTMTDHRTRERGHRFLRDFDGAGSEKFVMRLHQAANVQRSTLNVQRLIQKSRSPVLTISILFVFRYEADIAAALYVARGDVAKLFRFRIQTQIFFHVMSGDVIAAHGAQNEIAIIDD